MSVEDVKAGVNQVIHEAHEGVQEQTAQNLAQARLHTVASHIADTVTRLTAELEEAASEFVRHGFAYFNLDKHEDMRRNLAGLDTSHPEIAQATAAFHAASEQSERVTETIGNIEDPRSAAPNPVADLQTLLLETAAQSQKVAELSGSQAGGEAAVRSISDGIAHLEAYRDNLG